jgi:hypothetical protein
MRGSSEAANSKAASAGSVGVQQAGGEAVSRRSPLTPVQTSLSSTRSGVDAAPAGTAEVPNRPSDRRTRTHKPRREAADADANIGESRDDRVLLFDYGSAADDYSKLESRAKPKT